MIHFKDRFDAGKKLAHKLSCYKNDDHTLVLALPRGGVVCAYEIASYLSLPLDSIVVRKIGAPFNQELALGAVTETGEVCLDKKLMNMLSVTETDLSPIINEEKDEMKRRLAIYRKGLPERVIKDKIIILVDDGIATGATMKAALQTVQRDSPQKIVVAVPVVSQKSLQEIRTIADEVVTLEEAVDFHGIGQFYESFEPISDAEVIRLLRSLQDKISMS